MAILVDDAIWPWRGRLWAHLVSDTSIAELQEFAARLGIPERAFQGDHYDVTDELRDCAIAEGARAVTSRDVVRALRAAGLRKHPTRTAGHHQP
jgi:histone H3/H4